MRSGRKKTAPSSRHQRLEVLAREALVGDLPVRAGGPGLAHPVAWTGVPGRHAVAELAGPAMATALRDAPRAT